MNELIPTLNLNYFNDSHRKNRDYFVSQLKHAFQTTGFCFLRNHGIDQNSLGKAKSLFTEFFDLPESIRAMYEFSDEQHQRGYTPMRLEKGEFATIADEKHFFQIGNDRNVTVAHVPELKEVSSALFQEFRNCSLTLLRAIALSLEVDEHYFAEQEGNSIMRAIDYPPTDTPMIDDEETKHGGNIVGMCASKHTDINMITLLEAKEPGLQLWHGNEWIPVTITDPNLIIVNVGDMLWHLTGGRYVSGTHRVVCDRNTRRFSIPYFCHIETRHTIAPLAHLGFSDPKVFHFNTAGEFLDYRLNQIGL